MTDTPPAADHPRRQRPVSLRGHIAGVVAVVALVVAVGAWWWMRQQPPADAGPGLPHGVIVIGGGTFIAALIAEIRAMSMWDILEMLWEWVVAVFAMVGAVLKAILHGILALFGWD